MSNPIHIISLGAGVQSSCMALMAAKGEIGPMPVAAIFADTMAEPKSVYVWLDWLEKQLPFPVIRVQNGDLAKISSTPKVSVKSGHNYLPHAVPAYVLNADGTAGTYFRQCTDKHKLTPLKLEINQLRGESDAVVWIGISQDEILRARESQRKNVTHRWPLVDLKMSRQNCLEWMASNGYPKPPRSACTFCPYHSDREWRRLKTEDPESFSAAIKYEKDLQAAAALVPRLSGVPFLHSRLIPISEVDFSTEEERGQLNMFNNECEGMCGV